MTAHGFGRRALGTVLDMPQDGAWVILVFVTPPHGRVREVEAHWFDWGGSYGWRDRDGKPVIGTITAWRPIRAKRLAKEITE